MRYLCPPELLNLSCWQQLRVLAFLHSAHIYRNIAAKGMICAILQAVIQSHSEGGRKEGKNREGKSLSPLCSYRIPRSILQTVSGDVSKTSCAPSGDKNVIFDFLFPLPPSLGAGGTVTATRGTFHSAARQDPAHSSSVRCYLRK